MNGEHDVQEAQKRIVEIWNRMSIEAVKRHEPPHVIHVLREIYLEERSRLKVDS